MNSKMFILIACLFLSFKNANALELSAFFEDDGYPPFMIVNKSKSEKFNVTGVVPELFGAIFFQTKDKYEYKSKPLPWKRGLEYLKNGKLDLADFIFKKEEREEYLVYPKTPFLS